MTSHFVAFQSKKKFLHTSN